MRILFVITRAEPVGGAQVYVRDLVRALATRHEVAVACGGDAGWFRRHLDSHGVTCFELRHLVWEIRPAADLRGVRELRKLIETYRPELVSLHSSKAGLLGRIAARLTGVPTVFTVHGWAFSEGVHPIKRQIFLACEKFAGPLASAVITVSDYDRNLALRSGVLNPHRIHTIHNGVPDVPPELRAKPSLSPPRIVMVARFAAPKDHATLLRSLGELKAEPWTLSLVGDGPLRADAERLATELGIGDRVEWVGAVEDVRPYVARAQIAVLNSRWEGFPLTILEAMRAGLPVVASDVGGVREAVCDGVTGFLTPRGDAGALRVHLKRLIRDPELRVRMGMEGRRRYEQCFTFERMRERTEALYFAACSGD